MYRVPPAKYLRRPSRARKRMCVSGMVGLMVGRLFFYDFFLR